MRRGALRVVVPTMLLALAAACAGSSNDAAPTTAPSTTSTTAPVETGSIELGPEDRPAQLVAPDDVTAPASLVVLLHGYMSNADQHDNYLGVTEQAAARGLYVLLPDGTEDGSGQRFWDATPACCNFTGTPVDDVGYLQALIEEALEVRPIDPDRVYVLGHSNGGFMSYRLACELADEVAAIAVLAGSDLPTDDGCQPNQPVSVLHLHGTADGVIPYAGGQTIAAPFPAAVEVVGRWAGFAGCDTEPVDGERLDLDAGIDGSETAVAAYEGCAEGIDVQLDTIEGGVHSPNLDRERVGIDVLDWLLDHAR